MEELRNSAVPPEAAEQPPKAEEQKAKIVPGGRLATLLFVLIGGMFFWQSLLLYKKNPAVTGYAMFPLIVSGLLLLLTAIDYFQTLKIPSEADGLPVKEKIVVIAKYLFPKDSLVFLLISIAFYVVMLLGVPFMIAATVFLLGSMCYLIPHDFKKNLLYTAIIMAAVYAIFTLLFKVSLP